MSEVEIEPIRGLPEELPEGERILWQGEPRWRELARHAFHVRSIAIYFSVFIVARGLTAASDGQPPAVAVASALMVVPLAFAGLAILALLAWLNARTTVYTLTNRRVVMRYGIAFPMTVNIPFRIIASAAMKERASGDGDISLKLAGNDRLAFLHLWPHARPWRLKEPEPTLRSIPAVSRVAHQLAVAISDEVGGVDVSGAVESEADSGSRGEDSARSTFESPNLVSTGMSSS